MKIEQNKVFQPVTITLETREELDQFWTVLELAGKNQIKLTPKEKQFIISVCDWISNNVQI